MGGVGQILREARESKGISLREAEQETKIRIKYLEALEDEQYRVLPGRVYIRGFLRNYAQFLGLDGNEIVRQWREETGPTQEEPETGPMVDQPRSRYWLTLLLLGLVVGAIAYWWFGFRVEPEAPAGQVGQEMPVLPEPPVSALPQAEETAVPAVPEPVADSGSKLEIDKVQVEIMVEGKESWVEVRVDGAATYQALLRAGANLTFQGDEKVWLKLGDAAAVRLTVNGTVLDPVGGPGQVITREFTRTEAEDAQ